MQHLWTRRAFGIAEGLKVPPVIALCLRRNIDPCFTRTATFHPGMLYELSMRATNETVIEQKTRTFRFTHSRFSSRSATATPTGSPKKRQLPLIPTALKERAVQDLDERARFMRHRNRQMHTTYRSTGTGGELTFPILFAGLLISKFSNTS